MRRKGILGIACCLLLASPAFADEIDREYESWAKWRVGATIVYDHDTFDPGYETQGEIRLQLVERTEDRVVVERTISVIVDGERRVARPTRTVIEARHPVEPEGFEAHLPRTEGVESIVAAGTTYQASWVRLEMGAGSTVTRWTSADVPGLLIQKVECEGDRITSRQLLVSVEAEPG